MITDGEHAGILAWRSGSRAGGVRRAVFLDRDGVINRMVYDCERGLIDSPLHADQFELLAGAGEAIRLVNAMGWLAIVVSNQPGVAKGKCTLASLQATTLKMERELAALGAQLDAVYYCLHHPQAVLEPYRLRCVCRKPSPGLLHKAAADYGVELAASFMIGDDLTDIIAGRAAGCSTVLLGRHKCDMCQIMDEHDARPDFIVPTLPEAVRLIQQSPCKDPLAETGDYCRGLAQASGNSLGVSARMCEEVHYVNLS